MKKKWPSRGILFVGKSGNNAIVNVLCDAGDQYQQGPEGDPSCQLYL